MYMSKITVVFVNITEAAKTARNEGQMCSKYYLKVFLNTC